MYSVQDVLLLLQCLLQRRRRVPGRVLLAALVSRPELDAANVEAVLEAALHADIVDERLAELRAVVVGPVAAQLCTQLPRRAVTAERVLNGNGVTVSSRRRAVPQENAARKGMQCNPGCSTNRKQLRGRQQSSLNHRRVEADVVVVGELLGLPGRAEVTVALIGDRSVLTSADIAGGAAVVHPGPRAFLALGAGSTEQKKAIVSRGKPAREDSDSMQEQALLSLCGGQRNEEAQARSRGSCSSGHLHSRRCSRRSRRRS